jgi:hypothetical protein
LKTYAPYYNEVWTHLSLDKNAPDFRRPLPASDIAAISPLAGCIINTSVLGFD